MNCIKLLSIVRRVEREAARRGYSFDALVDDSMLPDTGTLGQELDVISISLDAKIGDLSTGDRKLVNRLIRNCVLSEPPRAQSNRGPSRPIHAGRPRAW